MGGLGKLALDLACQTVNVQLEMLKLNQKRSDKLPELTLNSAAYQSDGRSYVLTFPCPPSP